MQFDRYTWLQLINQIFFMGISTGIYKVTPFLRTPVQNRLQTNPQNDCKALLCLGDLDST